MSYCKNCNITYNNQADIFNDEYQNGCPVCELKFRLYLQQKQLRKTTQELRIYQICEKCQLEAGFCDRDKSTCSKLQSQLNFK